MASAVPGEFAGVRYGSVGPTPFTARLRRWAHGLVVVRVAPFHSKLPGTVVHHNDSACPEAAKLKLAECNGGTGGLPLCEECATIAARRREAT
jgi:hypothetical protein